MSGLTLKTKAKLLNDTFASGSLYAGLLTKMALDTAGSEVYSELVAVSYKRMPISFSITSSNEISNNASVKFPEAREDWGQIIGVGIFDSLSGGNLVSYAIFDVRDVVIIHSLMQYEVPKDFYVAGFRM